METLLIACELLFIHMWGQCGNAHGKKYYIVLLNFYRKFKSEMLGELKIWIRCSFVPLRLEGHEDPAQYDKEPSVLF